ncbi:RDD family protein [Streptomyces sp. NPDC004069]
MLEVETSGVRPLPVGELRGLTPTERAARRREFEADLNPLTGRRPEGSGTVYVTSDGSACSAGLDPAEATTVLVLAEPGRRVAARLIDTVLGAALFYLCVVVPAGLVALSGAEESDGAAALFFLVAVVVWLGYGVYCLTKWGATPGKRLMGLRVVRMWSDGTLPPRGAFAFAREWPQAVFLLIPGVNVVLAGIRLWHLLKDQPYHHSLFDRRGLTVVVRAPER